MGGSPVLPAWDTLILAIPFLGMLGMAMFGLDERVATSKTLPRTRRFFCEVEGKGRKFISDPDGKPWQKGAVRQIEARFRQPNGAGQMEAPHQDDNRRGRAARARAYIIEN